MNDFKDYAIPLLKLWPQLEGQFNDEMLIAFGKALGSEALAECKESRRRQQARQNDALRRLRKARLSQKGV